MQGGPSGQLTSQIQLLPVEGRGGVGGATEAPEDISSRKVQPPPPAIASTKAVRADEGGNIKRKRGRFLKTLEAKLIQTHFRSLNASIHNY